MKFINVGYGNLVALERIVSVAAPDSAPIKRIIIEAKESGRAIDLCCGKKCKSVIICDTDQVITSSLSLESLTSRIKGDEDNANDANNVNDKSYIDEDEEEDVNE